MIMCLYINWMICPLERLNGLGWVVDKSSPRVHSLLPGVSLIPPEMGLETQVESAEVETTFRQVECQN